MNKQQQYLHAKYVAFVNNFKKVCDPQGLIYVMSTGRMWANDEAKIIETIGDKYSKNSRMQLMRDLSYYGKNEFEVSMVDNKPKVNKQLKELAEKVGKEIVERYPLYQPK